MELTLPEGSLSPEGRADITRFYKEVFGWGAIDVELFEQNNLLLHTDDEVSQFLLLVENPKPIESPSFDHLGVLMDSRAEVDELLARCKSYRERDERVRIKEYDDLDQGVVVIRAFYVKYLLPIYFDVQFMEWKDGCEPAKRWSYSS
jgi:hypothetical protein